MSENMKKRLLDTKMVPVPSVAIVPERDVHKRPVLETRHLGIEFGLVDFGLRIALLHPAVGVSAVLRRHAHRAVSQQRNLTPVFRLSCCHGMFS